MQSDLPHTLYMDKDAKKRGKDAPVSASDPAFARQKAAYEKALARRKAQADGKEPYTVDELFRKN